MSFGKTNQGALPSSRQSEVHFRSKMSAGFQSTAGPFFANLFPRISPANTNVSMNNSFSSSYGQPQLPSRRLKLKRARQRVDAGEPRNIYSSSQPSTDGNGAKPSEGSEEQKSFSGPTECGSNLFHQLQGNGYQSGPVLPYMREAWIRLQQHALHQAALTMNDNKLRLCEADEDGERNVGYNQEATKGIHVLVDDGDAPICKKARVEDIIRNIQSCPPTPSPRQNHKRAAETKSADASPRSKRKQHQPQQLAHKKELIEKEKGSTHIQFTETETTLREPEISDYAHQSQKKENIENDPIHIQHTKSTLLCEAENSNCPLKAVTQGDKCEEFNAKEMLEIQQQWYLNLLLKQQQEYANHAPNLESVIQYNETRRRSLFLNTNKITSGNQENCCDSREKDQNTERDLKLLGQNLKSQLFTALSSTIDKIIEDHIRNNNVIHQSIHTRPQWGSLPECPAPPNRPMYFGTPVDWRQDGVSFELDNNATTTQTTSISTPFRASFPDGPIQNRETTDDKLRLLLTPKKKRSKVSDGRLEKVGVDLAQASSDGDHLLSMVSPRLNGSHFIGMENMNACSPSISDDVSDVGSHETLLSQSCTLTPMHLRKAKLMFFYTRYPSSALLKTYFPDIRFNKNTTAQLVKWFSNFREFYYIQVEKHARQAIAEGVRSADILLTNDSEIYKSLNQHYNRNNHIQVPTQFADVIQSTLQEFVEAIRIGKDTEPSWKKQIYKIVSRLDETIPDFFKTPNFLEDLE